MAIQEQAPATIDLDATLALIAAVAWCEKQSAEVRWRNGEVEVSLARMFMVRRDRKGEPTKASFMVQRKTLPEAVADARRILASLAESFGDPVSSMEGPL